LCRRTMENYLYLCSRITNGSSGSRLVFVVLDATVCRRGGRASKIDFMRREVRKFMMFSFLFMLPFVNPQTADSSERMVSMMANAVSEIAEPETEEDAPQGTEAQTPAETIEKTVTATTMSHAAEAAAKAEAEKAEKAKVLTTETEANDLKDVSAAAAKTIAEKLSEKAKNKKAKFDWGPVMEAIIKVESSGNPRAVSGEYAGAMQIGPALVEDCNQILKRRKSKKRYSLDDRFSVKKSKEMFVIYQSQYNPTNDVEVAIRSWNGGIHYRVRSTQRYFEKVTKLIKN